MLRTLDGGQPFLGSSATLSETRMRRRRDMRPDPYADFDWREIVCSDEAAAATEAERRQRLERGNDGEWIYLRNAGGQWVARRTPRDLKPRRSSREELLDSLLSLINPFSD